MEINQPGQSLDPSEYAASVTNLDGSLIISPTTGDVIASLNPAHSNTWTASQTFLNDTIFSEPDPVSSNTLKLIYYSKDDVLFQESWSLGYNNSLPVADLSQIVIGNNNTMSSFAGFIAGYGNTATTTEDIFLLGINNSSNSTSAGIGIGFSNTLGSGSLQFAIGHTNTLGNFNNLVAVGLGNSNSADSTATVGINLANSLSGSLDIGMSDASKTTLTTTYARFRTDVGIGTIPSSGLHILKTTEQLRLGYDASNYVTTTISSAGNLSWQTTAGATAGVYTLTPHGSGGSGTNRTLSFGRAWGNAALWLYNNGAGARFGWGMQNDAMQFFQPTTTGMIFTWNRGGDLQPNGTNELMRLTQYATRAGLSIGCGATSPHIFEGRLISDASASVSTEDFFRVHRQITGGVSYPQAFSMSLGRYVAPSTFSPNSSVDFRLKHSSSSNIVTDIGVMSLNSNGRVLIGGVGAAGSTCDVAGSLQCDSITNDTGLAHGTYTPTRSAEANMDANVTMFQAQYMRVGNTVTVSGRFTADPTLTATATSFEMTLPVASNIGAVEDLAGVAFCGAVAGMGAQISGSVANNTMVVTWVSTDITAQSWSFSATYEVI